MQRALIILLSLLAWAVAPARVRAQATAGLEYTVYAAGLHIADVETDIGIDPRSYQMTLAYRTTGLAGLFYRGHHTSSVTGRWQGDQTEPASFYGAGVWRGSERVARIDYEHGMPLIRQLIPPNEAEREPVPPSLQAHSIDTLSALLELIRIVSHTGRCDTTVRTYDGRRATEIDARSVGEELLPATDRSIFAGRALRCDFAGRMLAGFRFGDSPADARPLHGSTWLAAIVPGAPRLPVRLAFETRWFGDATMYLVRAGQAVIGTVARN
jgi:hypothetical protein